MQNVIPNYEIFGFYNIVICTKLNSIKALQFIIFNFTVMRISPALGQLQSKCRLLGSTTINQHNRTFFERQFMRNLSNESSRICYFLLHSFKHENEINTGLTPSHLNLNTVAVS